VKGSNFKNVGGKEICIFWEHFDSYNRVGIFDSMTKICKMILENEKDFADKPRHVILLIFQTKRQELKCQNDFIGIHGNFNGTQNYVLKYI
jgi:hypothetical protein